MASEGPKSPGTIVNVAGSGKDWINPGNAASSNDGYTTVTFIAFTLDDTSDYLRATGFGFNLPAGATIDGIVVEVEAKSDGLTHNWNSVLIVKGGSPTGTDQADVDALPGADAYKTFGGTTNKWGTTWTTSDINATGFGVQVQVIDQDGNGEKSYVDHIRITVYYTPAAGGPPMRMLIGVDR